MNFTTRPMQLEDINAVVLVDTIAGILLPWSPAAYVGELRKPTSSCWVAETVTDAPLAYLMPFALPVENLLYPAGAPAVIGSLTLWDIAGEGEIANVAVHPKFWRQGVGHALLQVALEKAVSLGMAKVLLEVRASNTPAKALYESLGFVEEGRRPHYYSNGEDAILMSLVPHLFVGKVESQRSE